MKVGDNVTWESQSGGWMTRKTGKIVRIVKGNDEPCSIAYKEFPNHRLMFDGFSLPRGYDVAYLIEVITGPRAQPRLYMPYPKHLRPIK